MTPLIRRQGKAASHGRRAAPWIVCAAAALLAVACGYRFQGEAKLPAGAQTLFVDMFENRTNQANLETVVTNAVVFEFIKRSRTAVVGDASEADLVMRGVIRSVELKSVSSRNKDAAGERNVKLTLDVKLVQPGGRVVWSANGLSDGDAYVVSNDAILNSEKQQATLGIVATRIAEKIYNRFTDDF
jgi:outer membrane lipopolysaccharide assembly protein LptE/RlpB